MAKKKKDDHHHSPPKPDPDGGGERPAPPQDPAPDWAEMPGFRRHDRMTPADLIGRLNPQNPKIHGDDQLASIRESIRRFGWIVPVVLNERTGLLVDGHARVKIAAADGMADVPVVIGDWSEDEEREILAVFDAIGAQAGLDAEKFRALKARLIAESPALNRLMASIQEDPWFRRGLGDRGDPAMPRPVLVPLAGLTAHPRNFQEHPDDQIEELAASLRENGIYRPIIVARGDVILAGHGLARAAEKAGYEDVPVIRLDLDPDDTRALRLLVGDNEINHLAERDDRVLTEVLKSIKDREPTTGLTGTGFDGPMLANLVMVTRPASEVKDFDAAAEWVGMPEYEPGEKTRKCIVSFRNAADRAQFARLIGQEFPDRDTVSVWWPAKQKDDLSSVRFEDGSDEPEPEPADGVRIES